MELRPAPTPDRRISWPSRSSSRPPACPVALDAILPMPSSLRTLPPARRPEPPVASKPVARSHMFTEVLKVCRVSVMPAVTWPAFLEHEARVISFPVPAVLVPNSGNIRTQVSAAQEGVLGGCGVCPVLACAGSLVAASERLTCTQRSGGRTAAGKQSAVGNKRFESPALSSGHALSALRLNADMRLAQCRVRGVPALRPAQRSGEARPVRSR